MKLMLNDLELSHVGIDFNPNISYLPLPKQRVHDNKIYAVCQNLKRMLKFKIILKLNHILHL